MSDAQKTDRTGTEPDPDRHEEPEAHLEEVELEETGDQSGAQDAAELDEVDALKLELEQVVGKWQRAQADYQNLKRRTQTDVENRLRRTMEPLLRNLLLVLDHLDMALMSPTESQDARNLAIGVEMVRKQMVTALEESEVERIEDGGAFDPEWHQAVGEVETEDAEPGTVVDTVRRGYRWRGRALRHAEVRVARAPGSEEDTAESTGSPADGRTDDRGDES